MRKALLTELIACFSEAFGARFPRFERVTRGDGADLGEHFHEGQPAGDVLWGDHWIWRWHAAGALTRCAPGGSSAREGSVGLKDGYASVR
jgi:hypothetical protein